MCSCCPCRLLAHFWLLLAPEAKAKVETLFCSQNSMDAPGLWVNLQKDLSRSSCEKLVKKQFFPTQADDPYARILSTKT